MRCFTFVYVLLCFVHSAPALADGVLTQRYPAGWKSTLATDSSVTTQGVWVDDRFRFADAPHRYTVDDQASLKWKTA